MPGCLKKKSKTLIKINFHVFCFHQNPDTGCLLFSLIYYSTAVQYSTSQLLVIFDTIDFGCFLYTFHVAS